MSPKPLFLQVPYYADGTHCPVLEGPASLSVSSRARCCGGRMPLACIIDANRTTSPLSRNARCVVSLSPILPEQNHWLAIWSVRAVSWLCTAQYVCQALSRRRCHLCNSHHRHSLLVEDICCQSIDCWSGLQGLLWPAEPLHFCELAPHDASLNACCPECTPGPHWLLSHILQHFEACQKWCQFRGSPPAQDGGTASSCS